MVLTGVFFFLADFFRFAFDGSGADNFYDAGSCIDGRLTSAWNCKCIVYPLVLLLNDLNRVLAN